MAKSDSIKELAGALSKGQGEFPTIAKNRTANVPMKAGGKYSYRYADLADVISAIAPVLAKNGLSISQAPTIIDSKLVLETTLMHASGEWMTSVYPLQSYDRPQEMGSEITYARRYTLTSILGIHAEEDDDGAIAGTAKEAVVPARMAPPNLAPVSNGDPAEYKPTFGKYSGQALKTLDIYALGQYVEYIGKNSLEEGKPIQGKVAEFMEMAGKFLASREATVERLDQYLAGTK
jgi:ERF superfamily protein